jgi:hypothetical protein
MSEQVYDEVDGTAPAAATNGELVHWGQPKPLRVGPAGMSATAGVAFTVGVVATVVVLALLHWLGPEREVELPRRRVRA